MFVQSTYVPVSVRTPFFFCFGVTVAFALISRALVPSCAARETAFRQVRVTLIKSFLKVELLSSAPAWVTVPVADIHPRYRQANAPERTLWEAVGREPLYSLRAEYDQKLDLVLKLGPRRVISLRQAGPHPVRLEAQYTDEAIEIVVRGMNQRRTHVLEARLGGGSWTKVMSSGVGATVAIPLQLDRRTWRGLSHSRAIDLARALLRLGCTPDIRHTPELALRPFCSVFVVVFVPRGWEGWAGGRGMLFTCRRFVRRRVIANVRPGTPQSKPHQTTTRRRWSGGRVAHGLALEQPGVSGRVGASRRHGRRDAPHRPRCRRGGGRCRPARPDLVSSLDLNGAGDGRGEGQIGLGVLACQFRLCLELAVVGFWCCGLALPLPPPVAPAH